jgi:RNA polymerase sigma factor (sigma-70 family)
MEVLETTTVRPITMTAEELYEKAFPLVAGFVSKMKGSFQEARDVFHDALVIYYEKLSLEDFSVTVAPEAYILGIAKHLWVRKFNRDTKNISWDDRENEMQVPEAEAPSPDDVRLLHFLELTGQKCLNVLRAFYFEKLSLRSIAKHFGYSTEHSATVQKYKCIEKIREVVKQKAYTYEDFLN